MSLKRSIYTYPSPISFRSFLIALFGDFVYPLLVCSKDGGTFGNLLSYFVAHFVLVASKPANMQPFARGSSCFSASKGIFCCNTM